MLRRLFTLLSAVSLVLCVVTCALWVRSHQTPHGREDAVGGFVASRHARYTLRSERGSLTPYGPPGGASDVDPDMADLVGHLRNEQVYCQANVREGEEVEGRPTIRLGTPLPPLLHRSTAAAAIDYRRHGGPFSPADCRALLAAMERPEAFFAAAFLLDRATLPSRMPGNVRAWQREYRWSAHRGCGESVWAGVRLTLWTDWVTRPQSRYTVWPVCSAAPSEMAAARDAWHRQLDVPITSVPHWAAVAMLALPALGAVTKAARRVRSRHWRRGDRCPACGYDVRATPDRCPECGTAQAKTIHST